MKAFLGIDLGSTTSKAVLVDSTGKIIGRGITNTRSNYTAAASIAQIEAEFNSRFTLLDRKLKEIESDHYNWDDLIFHLENRFYYLQFLARFEQLLEALNREAQHIERIDIRENIIDILPRAARQVNERVKNLFYAGEVSTTSQFFRDLFSTAYVKAIENTEAGLFDQLVALYDRCITPVENHQANCEFGDLVLQSLNELPDEYSSKAGKIESCLNEITKIDLNPSDYVGTGYGRQLLPFEEKHIKSEILCHAMGAHKVFPGTRTVLDIGGQDTKAIQVDPNGLVTSFQMNDRCAAGCGRYLGYIADEMSISVGELGALAIKADHEANICSTCTVFAGAELREYLNLGERKENILAGLHRAIVQRAFALIARSGGVRNEFTFTGGVARNPAILKYVSQMVTENYGKITINYHPDSIFMGALGAALFAARRT